ncbi:AAA family ATPase [Hamadaea sp.]|uniref:AAA family ATPase n=1 Tax=Hamadaea sp. TaxID=2024425 RepID=UPI0025C097F4|nr:AAA family ATPase [Hamadaea sp.]
MRARSRTGGLVVIAILLSSVVPIGLFASPTAAMETLLVLLFGILIGLITQGLLNRRTTGRFRLAWRRRPAYLVPADLPPPPGLLVGREAELARICALLRPDRPTGEPPIVVLTGDEGVGKTALAVTVAHLVAPHFADGQILVRFDTQRPDGDDYARMYLARALSEAAAEAPAEGEFDRWYRRHTAHRQLLVVLDNVADSVDVRRFLPAGRRCAAIVTSRAAVRDLDDAYAETVRPLSDEAAGRLLHVLGGDAADGVEPRHADRIVAAADGYPAALQMAGAVLRTRRSWDLDVAFGEAEALLDDAVPTPEAGTGPAFLGVLNLACALLTDQERRCLALLSLLDTRRAAPWMLAALAGGAYPDEGEVDEVTAARILDRLTRVRFAEVRVDERSGVTVYRVPGYVKAYARHLLPSEVDSAAVARAIAAYSETYRARLQRSPERAARLTVYHLLDIGHLDEALAAARENLQLAQERRKAAERGAADLDTATADERLAEVALAEVFAELGWIDDALAYAVAAERSTLASTRMRSLRIQGRVRWRLRQTTAAIEKLLLARQIAETQFPHDYPERIRILRELTVAYALDGKTAAALDAGELAVRLCDETPREARRRPGALWAYGMALTAGGHLAEAEAVLGQADALSGNEELEQGLWRPWIRYQRAEVALARREFDAARGLAASALKGFTALIHRYGSGHCRELTGRAYFLEGAFDRAVPILEEALQTFERCGDRWIEADTAYWLGRAYATEDGRSEDALSMMEAALTVFERLKDQAAAARTQSALRELEGSRPPWLVRRSGTVLPDTPKALA